MVAGKYNADRYRFSEARQKKRHQRRLRTLRTSWQTALGLGLLWGLWHLTNAPLWYLYSPDQITIEGENLLAEGNLKSLIRLPFPQYVFQAEPQTIARQLQAQAPLARVEVNRQLFPARLVVRVTERVPVAHAMYGGKNGYIDREGVWIPATSYTHKLTLPLVVQGFNDTIQTRWAEIYPLLASSPVQIKRVNWLDVNNLILHTDLGVVHCGEYDRETLIAQLDHLDRLRQLPKYLNSTSFLYLDLRDISATTAKLPTSIP